MEHAAEALRVFLVRNVFTPMSGLTFSDWMSLLRRHGFRIAPRYWPRAAFVTLNSIATSVRSARESREFESRIRDVQIKAPIFVLGHWRSGTTHLHNLLSLDTQFAYPNFYQVTNPHTFLTTEAAAKNAKAFKLLSPKTRLIDNMEATLDSPMEDEVALAVLTGLSPILDVAFPLEGLAYDKYLTFRDVSYDERSRWKDGFLLFMKKLTLLSGRQLILKSPPHTCRIKLLLELFPDAFFIHIHRNPYVVFKSYARSIKIMQEMMQLQRADNSGLEARIIEQYKTMHDVFLEERDLVPKNRFFELSYEEIEQHPMLQIQSIYEHFGLPGFEAMKPSLGSYLGKISNYQKSELSDLSPQLKKRISDAWGRYFDEWDYSV
ncbi:sulfotransferase family protein [Aromatoleum diolicum]|uniref:Sulfotransferase n=1 Tax=Aromatoleum diolicum TaxID=75796 RepID=A0ABX1QED1_9RHOO|nr:sulfotransferase [Aromatoleum diolicum]NMG76288.1 sulfotransferase [Aromatoleum diolicum]